MYDSSYEITAPTRIGYAFNRFEDEDGNTIPLNGKWTIAKDLDIFAYWDANPDTKYVINHYTEDLNGGGYIKVNTENLFGFSDITLTVNSKHYEGFTPVEVSKQITIAADGSTIVDFYYTRNSYTITFVSNGGTRFNSETYKYEQQIPSTLKPTRTGFTFAGWYSNEKQTTLFDKMPAGDQTVYAYYAEETKASYFDYTFSGQEAKITKGNGLPGNIVVPEYIGGKAVTEIGDNAFLNCSSITEITLSDQVQELGAYAFKGCSALIRINGTSNLEIIKDGTFEGCRNLSYFPDLSNVISIGICAFKDCSSLTFINISNCLTSVGDYAFQNCVMLLQTPDLTNIASIGDYAFQGCKLLTEIKSLDGCATFGEGIFTACENIAKITLSFRESIEQFYVSNLFGRDSSIDSSKYYQVTGKNGSICYIPKTLTEIEFDTTGRTPDYFLYNLSSITKVSDKSTSSEAIGKHAFDGCVALANYAVQNANISSVDEYAFQNCSSLISLPGFDLGEVKRYAFTNCSSLLVAPILDNATYIGDYAFSGCSLITSIKIPNSSYMGLNSLYGCSSLIELEIPFVGTTISSSEAFGVIFGTTSYDNSYAVAQLSKTYYIPNSFVKLTVGGSSIKEGSCVNLLSITSLIISDSVESIEKGAFKGCDSIENITLPFVGKTALSTGYEGVFGYIFGYYKPSITTEYTTSQNKGYTTQGVCHFNSEKYGFYIPTSIKNVIITVQTSIPDNAFKNCDLIEHIVIPTFTISIGSHALDSCSNLLTLNSNIDGAFNIPTGVKVINDYAFAGCAQVSNVNLSNSVTSIGNHAFSGCILIEKFNSSNDLELIVPTSCELIGNYAFENCDLINTVIVPDTVSSIGYGAFKGCDSIENITLPFVGKTALSTGYEGVFGYIFGYYKPSITTEYTTSQNKGYTTQGVCHFNSEKYGFYIPTSIKNVIITVQTSIPDNAFKNCDLIETIHLIEGSLCGNNALTNCSASIIYDVVPQTSAPWDGVGISSSYHGGNGTEQNPYQIFTASEFLYFISQINSGVDYSNTYFILTSNINLGGYSINQIAPTLETSFNGIFDGVNKILMNYTISDECNEYNGLFGYITGTIKNLKIKNATINLSTAESSTYYCGFLVGNLSGSIENVNVSGQLIFSSKKTCYVGGLVGYNTGELINCECNVFINATSTNYKCYVGGLIGYNIGNYTGCTFTGTITAKGYSDSYTIINEFVGFNN